MASRIIAFSSISGVGWLIDMALFATLITLGMAPPVANLMSAGVAVSMVFCFSTYSVFVSDGGWMGGKFLAYITYQVCAVCIASLLIKVLLTYFMLWSVAAKIIVTPLTCYANFLFMSTVIEGRPRYY